MSKVPRAAVALLASLMCGVAVAQPTDAGAYANVYDLYQGPANVGEFGATFRPAAPITSPAGSDLSGVSSSYVQIPGLLDFGATLTVGPDGSAQAYQLTGTVQGVAVEITAEFNEGGVSIGVVQAGQASTFELASSEPLYVVDNNFIDGLQLVARRAVLTPGEELEVAIVVPQAVLLGSATASASEGLEALDHAGASITTRRVDVVMMVAGQTIASTVWLDEAGDIVVLEQPASLIRFVRRGAGATGSADGAAGGDGAAGAGAFLENARGCVDVTEVTVQSTGETLAGVLTLPAHEGGVQALPAPTLLVLPGSGAVDLAGNALPIIRNAGLEQLAYALGCQGYGVLRIAKLGIPPSTGDGNAVVLDTYARNAADWLAMLAVHPGVDPQRLGLIGHSEGGLVALYAAATGFVDPAVLVLVATPGRPMDVLIEEQLLARAEESGATDEELAELRAQVLEAVAAIKASTGTRLDLTGDLAANPVAQLFGHAAGLLRTEMEQDPAALIAALDQPVLIVQGDKDLQVRPADGAALAAGAPGARLVALTDLTHNLVDFSGPALAGLVPDPDAVISAELLLVIDTFLGEHLRTGTP